MRRRHYLVIVGTGLLAGCGSEGSSAQTDTATPTPSATPSRSPTVTPSASATATPTATATPEPPSFELVGYEFPETVEIGEPITFGVGIRNTGGQTGDFSAPLYGRATDASEWQEGGEWTWEDVPPGETVTAESNKPFTFEYINSYEYRIGTFEPSDPLQVVTAKLDWGETFTTPEGYKIRVDRPALQDSYETTDYQNNVVTRTPSERGQWAFVTVWVKNETGSADYSPLAGDFALLYDNSQADGTTILTQEPTDRDKPFDGGELQPGVERSGWIAYQLPTELAVEDLTMAWSEETYEGRTAARWGAG